MRNQVVDPARQEDSVFARLDKSEIPMNPSRKCQPAVELYLADG